MRDFIKVYSDEVAALVKEALAKATAVDGDGTFEVIATTETVDRDGDIIQAEGWDVSAYLKNPVVLWAHKYDQPPIGAITDIKMTPQGMVVSGVFAKTEAGQEIRKLYDDGIIRAMSVGFLPKERTGKVISKQELLEVSFVPVPANAEALTLRRTADAAETMEKMFGVKGQVADVADAQAAQTYETQNEKWQDMDAVYSVIYALSEVYYRPETEPEQFADLLGEAITLLQAVRDEEVAEDGEAGILTASKAFEGRYKAGRVLSAKNKEKMEKAMDHATQCAAHLKDVLDAGSDAATDDEKSQAAADDGDRLKGVDLDIALSTVRAIDKACETSLVFLKKGVRQ